MARGWSIHLRAGQAVLPALLLSCLERHPMWRSTPHLDRFPVGVMRGVYHDITDADDAFLRIVGYTRTDLETGSLPWPAMTPPEYLHLDQAGMRQAADSGGFTAPYRKQFIRKDGSRVDVLLVCAFLPDTAGGWIGYVVDLSAPTTVAPPASGEVAPLSAPVPSEMYGRLVGELVRERTRMLSMLDHTPALIWAIDRRLCLLSANEAFQAAQSAVSGRRLDIGDPVLDRELYPPAYIEPWIERYGRALQGEQFSVTSQYDHGSPSDVEFLLSPIRDGDGAVVGATIVAQDITQRMAAEREARAHEARFQHLAQSVPVGVLVADAQGGLTYANARAQQILALPDDSGAPAAYLDAVFPDDRATLEAMWERARVDGVAECSVGIRQPSGAERVVRWRVEPLADAGSSGAFVGIVEDETERVAAVERRRQREKMESLGTLAGGIAHDFNNLLTVILAHAESASEPGLPAGEYLDAIDNIRAAGFRARDLVRQILTFSRRDQPVHQPVDFARLAGDTARLLRSVLPAAVTLDIDGIDQPLMVMGDMSGLQQVVLNLVMNAAHALRDVPSPRIKVRVRAAAPPQGAAAQLVVSDNGCGIPRAVRDRIFEPFFTTKPVGEGTGMGLAVVRGIIDTHRGDVEVWSEPGQGARFTVTLPLAPGMA